MYLAHPTAASADEVFTALVADLTQAVTGDDSPLAAALAEDLGVPVVLDTDAFVAPTTFTQAEIKVSTNAPTLYPTVMLIVPVPCQTYLAESIVPNSTITGRTSRTTHALPLENVGSDSPTHRLSPPFPPDIPIR